jgi:ribose-phosphate pyrophosphokinase
MSSDAGGFKPLIKLATHLEWDETFSASKSRDSKTHKLTQLIDRQDFEGKDVLIVDDICVYGGTFIGLSHIINDYMPKSLNLYATHGIFSKGLDPLFNAKIDRIYTTNSFFSWDKLCSRHPGDMAYYKSNRLTIIKI